MEQDKGEKIVSQRARRNLYRIRMAEIRDREKALIAKSREEADDATG